VGRAAAGQAVPAAVRAAAGGAPLRLVWRNAVGGLTFTAGSGAQRRFLKWAPAGSGLDLGAEARRLAWAVAFTPVPRVLDQGTDATGSWLVTAALAGGSAVAGRWRRTPPLAVDAIGHGLRALHDALPTDRCPFSWSAAERLADARRRADRGDIDPTQWHPEHRRLQAAQALRRLEAVPPVDRLVVCHGDACTPNTLLTARGRWSGHVDLGSLGVGDRWADLAIATWSVTWNYGPGWEDRLLAAYGVTADPQRIRYYRLLWDLDP